MAGGAGSLITVVRAGPDPSAAPQQKKTHISQTHSVTSCRSSVVRLNKYAAFDVCCVIFIYFFCISTAGRFLHLFSTFPLLVAQYLFGIERRVKRSTQPLPRRPRVSLVSNTTHSLHTDMAEIGARRLAVAAVPSALHAARATTNLSVPHLSPPNKSPSASDCVWGRIPSAAHKQNRRAPGDERRTRFKMM